MDPKMLATGLYGNQRTAKNTPKELSSTTSLSFASTLTSLLSVPPPPRTTGRTRPSKTKTDIFSGHNRNAQKRALKDVQGEQVHSTSVEEVDSELLKRSRRKLEEKAKKYKAMKRGDGEEENGLIDWDGKWAEHGDSSGSDDDDGNEVVEYEDEYGRLRRGPKADADRMERRKLNKLRGAEELDRMSARPAMPEKLIYGDVVQTEAFAPGEEMEALAKKRDRSATPPPMQHYEADKEVRSKGVGFFAFSKDESIRREEMEALERERLETERARQERERKKEARRKEIEERRKAIGEKRAKKEADSFLEGLGAGFTQSEGV